MVIPMPPKPDDEGDTQLDDLLDTLALDETFTVHITGKKVEINTEGTCSNAGMVLAAKALMAQAFEITENEQDRATLQKFFDYISTEDAD